MFNNYIKIAVRNLFKYKGYTFINIFGLAAGIICCILILLYVSDELSYEDYYADADDIYRLALAGTMRDSELKSALTAAPWGLEITESAPEIKKFARLKTPMSRFMVEYEGRNFFEKGFYFADSTFFEIFEVEFIAGNPETSLDRPFSVVITDEMAEKYFPGEDPMGKVITADLTINLNVTGIIKKLPRNSHLQYEFITSFSTLDLARDTQGNRIYGDLGRNWFQPIVYTYFLLDPGTNIAEFDAKMGNIIDKRIGRFASRNGMVFEPYLQNIQDIHLKSHLQGEISPNSEESYIYIFSAIAAFILLIACINFMNLSTARSANRAKEVGVRKVTGAHRIQLVNQFLSESIIITLIATFVAIGCTAIFIPVFNSIADKNFDPMMLLQPKLLGTVFLFTLFVGFLAGSYPALLLSAFKPVDTLSGSIKAGASSTMFRRILVVIQFSISIFMIIGLNVISDQMDYIQNKRLGFDKELLVAVPLSDADVRTRFESLKNLLLPNQSIVGVTACSTIPGGIFNTVMTRQRGRPMDQNVTAQLMAVNYDFVEQMGLALLEGRGFSQEYTTDMNRAVILNQEAVKQFRLDTPIGSNLLGFSRTGSPVIGVVEDFHFKSLHEKIEPFILLLAEPNAYIWAYIKINAEDIPNTLSFIEDSWRLTNPSHPFDYTFVDDNYAALYESEMKLSSLFRFFTLVAIVIACLGLFGLASFTAEQRTKEIGIRKAIGASVNNIVYILSLDFTKWVLVANLFAWPAAYYYMVIWLQGFAYKTDISLLGFIGSGLLTLIIAFATVSYQAFKAASADPTQSLKYE